MNVRCRCAPPSRPCQRSREDLPVPVYALGDRSPTSTRTPSSTPTRSSSAACGSALRRPCGPRAVLRGDHGAIRGRRPDLDPGRHVVHCTAILPTVIGDELRDRPQRPPRGLHGRGRLPGRLRLGRAPPRRRADRSARGRRGRRGPRDRGAAEGDGARRPGTIRERRGRGGRLRRRGRALRLPRALVPRRAAPPRLARGGPGAPHEGRPRPRRGSAVGW